MVPLSFYRYVRYAMAILICHYALPYSSGSQLQSLSTHNSTHFCCSPRNINTWFNSLRAWWLVDKLNQVCLSRATIQMCTVGCTQRLELGTTVLEDVYLVSRLVLTLTKVLSTARTEQHTTSMTNSAVRNVFLKLGSEQTLYLKLMV